jgi:hypothetical protein
MKQGVGLNPEVVQAAENGTPNTFYPCHTPQALFAAIAEAGRTLRKDPDAQLAKKPLEGDWGDDIRAATLQRMINDSITHPDMGDLPSFKSDGIGPLSTCARADNDFTRILSDFPNIPDIPTRIVLDEEGEPIIVQKFHNNIPSALSLSDIVIDNVRYPAGSLLSMEVQEDNPDISDRDRPQLTVASMDEVEKLGFLRLSMLATDPKRSGALLRDGWNDTSLDFPEAQFYQAASMEKAQAAAEQTIKQWQALYEPET